jgi:hypothetical protein
MTSPSSIHKFDEMIGAVIENVSGAAGDEEMVFTAQDGRQFRFWHESDCCESVAINDVIGDLSWLVGYPISEAEEISSEGHPDPEDADSFTWTFYRFSTVRGTVTVRWLGESNGYYSESVDFEVLKPA